MTDQLTSMIYAAFPQDGVAPGDLVAGDQSNWECRELLLALSGKKWQDIQTMESFLKVFPDTSAWPGCLPVEWFPYYLPALLLVSHRSEGPQFENLRSILSDYLHRSTYSDKRCLEVLSALDAELTKDQKNAVTAFLQLHKLA